MSILLDTNALIWTLNDEVELGASARQQIEHVLTGCIESVGADGNLATRDGESG